MAHSSLQTFLKTLLARTRWEREMSEEMQFHLEQRTEDLVRSGAPRPEAVRRARLEFGGVEGHKEDCREARGLHWVDELRRNLSCAVRTLRSSPGFATVAILSLALGIGANTAIFTLIDRLLLKALPVRNAHELVLFRDPRFTDSNSFFSYQAYAELRDRSQVLTGLAASCMDPVPVGSPGSSEWVQGEYVSGNYFSVLGVKATFGRLITPDDDQLPGNRVAVLSNGYWRRRYGADPAVLGRTILIAGRPFVVIGITPPGFLGDFVGAVPDIQVPLTTSPDVLQAYNRFTEDPFWEEIRLFGRLRPGASRQSAEASLAGLFRQIRQQQAEIIQWNSAKSRQLFLERRLTLEPGAGGFSGLRVQYRQPLLLLMSATGLLLLIACANFSSLSLARYSSRRREIALRLALGARRAHLARQLLAESIILTLGGAFAGVLFAWWGCTAILTILPRFSWVSHLPFDVTPDLRVLGFTLAVALAAGIVIGLSPVWQSAGVRPIEAIKDGGSAVFGGKAQLPVRRVLIVSQVALSIVLLAGAGVLVRTLRNLVHQDFGMDRQHVLGVRLVDAHYSAYSPERWRMVFLGACPRIY